METPFNKSMTMDEISQWISEAAGWTKEQKSDRACHALRKMSNNVGVSPKEEIRPVWDSMFLTLLDAEPADFDKWYTGRLDRIANR